MLRFIVSARIGAYLCQIPITAASADAARALIAADLGAGNVMGVELVP